MKTGQGYFCVDRAIWDHPDFDGDEFTKREAWLWLIAAAAFKRHKSKVSAGRSVLLERGELICSVRFLADRWRWSKSRVSRFIGVLVNKGRLRDASRDKLTIYSVSNYNDYQHADEEQRDSERDSERDTIGTPSGQVRDKERDKVEEGYKGKRVEETQTPPRNEGGARRKPKTREKVDYDVEFEQFWKAYDPPKNSAKREAFVAWGQVADDRPPLADLLVAVRAHNAWIAAETRKRRADQPKKMAETWLRKRAWEPFTAGPLLDPARTAEVQDKADRLLHRGKYAQGP